MSPTATVSARRALRATSGADLIQLLLQLTHQKDRARDDDEGPNGLAAVLAKREMVRQELLRRLGEA